MLDLKQIESFYPESLRPFKRNLLREYIQYKILDAIFRSDFGDYLVFMGGTAAHIIHGNTRFSEDLDFDNLGLSEKDFGALSAFVKKRLAGEGYTAEVKNTFKGAYTANIKIPRILYDSKVSSHEQEILLVKIDAEPQGIKYTPDKEIINKFDVFLRINSVPMAMLLSQKLYAIFMRKRPVGRDFYDAAFLMAKTKPDMAYLEEKLGIKDIADLGERLSGKCARLDFKQLAKDVEPFLFNPGDAQKVVLFAEYAAKCYTRL